MDDADDLRLQFPERVIIKQLRKQAERGFRGYPVATVALYGPDNKRATKVAVGILQSEDAEVEPLRRWLAESGDVRTSLFIWNELQQFLRVQSVRSVSLSDGIIGCPHEEGVDYPEGEVCPECPHWAGRNRWTGELLADEPLGEELFVNEPPEVLRSGVVLIPRQPFIDWARDLDCEGFGLDADDEATVYLLPPAFTGAQLEARIEDHYARLFQAELYAWHRDPDDWPRPRTFELFQAWFEVHQHSEVVDLGEGPLLEV